MGAPKLRYIARATPPHGWRIYDRKLRRFWGNPLTDFPEELLRELNGAKHPRRITELTRRMQKP